MKIRFIFMTETDESVTSDSVVASMLDCYTGDPGLIHREGGDNR